MKENTAPAVAPITDAAANDKSRITYEVGGETVNLSLSIVRRYLCRGDGNITDGEILMFMSLCRANKLNPFTGDAYLVKYGSRNGMPPSPAQMITSKEAFMKRAENGPAYEGFQAGVIVVREGRVEMVEGAFFLPSDALVGGWCDVFRADRSQPFRIRVRLAEYNTDKSTWKAKPGTMIRKVAIAQAFREAYPINVGGLYTPDEIPQAPDDQPQAMQEVPVLDAPPAEAPAIEQAAIPAQAPAPEPEPIPLEADPLEGVDESVFSLQE